MLKRAVVSVAVVSALVAYAGTAAAGPVLPRASLAPLRPFRSFTRQNFPALPQNSVSAIAQDADGVIWFGTLDGLASYDGHAMADAGAVPGAPALGAVSAVTRRGAGGIYVGGTAGLHSRTVDGTWRYLGDGQAIVSIAEESPGVLWAVDQQGHLHRVSDDGHVVWETIPLPAGAGPALAVAAGQGGATWVASHAALYRIVDDGLPETVAAAGTGHRITALAVDHAGTPWFGTSAGALGQPDESAVRRAPQQACPAGVTVTALVEDWRERIWAGCADGRLSVGPRDGPREVWGADEGLRIDTRVIALAVDRHGALWVGRNGLGVLQLVSERWRHRSHWAGTERHASGESVFGISPMPAGGALMAVFSRGVWRWDGTRVEEIGRERGLTENTRYAVEPEPGVLWVGGRFGLYESRQGGDFRRVLTLASGFVTGLRRAPSGEWYALTSVAGLWTLRQGTWVPVTAINAQLPHQSVRAATWRSTDELWLATGAGVAVVRNGTVTALNQSDEPGAFLANCILALPDGDVWVGGMGGLWIWHANRWRHLTAANGLPGRTVYTLALAPDGAVWAGGAVGVGRFKDGVWETYTRDSGLIEDECALEGLAVLPDGRVMVGTLGSLAVFDPLAPVPPSPPLGLVWRTPPPSGDDGVVRLAEGKRDLLLRWSAPWLTGEPVEFRTRMRPEQAEYSPPSNKTELDLSRLAPGRWGIEVQARLGGARPGPWTAPLTLQIDVAPYFYERWWARLLALGVLLSLVPLGVKVRTLRMEQRQRDLQKAVDEALADVKTLTGLIPICASCKRIRDDYGSWNQLEAYLRQHSDATLSHGICPDCMMRLYPDYVDRG